MSEEMKVPVGMIVDAVNEGVFRALKKIKTSMVNIRTIVKLEKQTNDEIKIYQESINEYILQNGTGEGTDKKIDTSNPVIRNNYIAHVMELRNSDSDIVVLSKPIFSEKDLEAKGIELSAEEAIIFNAYGLTDIDLGEDEEIDESEESPEAEEETEEITEEESPTE